MLFFYNDDASQIQVNSIKFYGTGGTNIIDFNELKKNPVTWGSNKLIPY